MAQSITCELCTTQMSKVGTMNSGNSRFNEYVCKSCWTRKTLCQGLQQL